LTIEASVHGQRLVVDPGTYGYDRGERRRYDRSTKAHNTVCIDDWDSSEVWHIFRTGRRARPVGVEVRADADQLTAVASHDGYDVLPGSPRHQRKIEAARGSSRLTLTDRVEGSGDHVVEGGLLIHPFWSLEPLEDGWLATSGDSSTFITFSSSQQLEFFSETRPLHPRHGIEIQGIRVGWRFRGRLPVQVDTTLTAN